MIGAVVRVDAWGTGQITAQCDKRYRVQALPPLGKMCVWREVEQMQVVKAAPLPPLAGETFNVVARNLLPPPTRAAVIKPRYGGLICRTI